MDYTFWRVLSQPKWLDKSKSKVVVWINTEFNSNFHFHFSDFVNVESIQYIEQYEYLYHNYGSTRANGFGWSTIIIQYSMESNRRLMVSEDYWRQIVLTLKDQFGKRKIKH